MAEQKLTYKQEQFCQLVASGKTYADAYRGAYNVGKMGNNTIYVNSSVLMADNKIAIRVQEITEQHMKDKDLTLNDIVSMMKKIVQFNAKNMFKDGDGGLKSIHDMSDDDSWCIQDFEVRHLYQMVDGVKVVYGDITKVKTLDKKGIIDMFNKSFGAYIERKKIEFEDLSEMQELIKQIKE